MTSPLHEQASGPAGTTYQLGPAAAAWITTRSPYFPDAQRQARTRALAAYFVALGAVAVVLLATAGNPMSTVLIGIATLVILVEAVHNTARWLANRRSIRVANDSDLHRICTIEDLALPDLVDAILAARVTGEPTPMLDGQGTTISITPTPDRGMTVTVHRPNTTGGRARTDERTTP